MTKFELKATSNKLSIAIAWFEYYSPHIEEEKNTSALSSYIISNNITENEFKILITKAVICFSATTFLSLL